MQIDSITIARWISLFQQEIFSYYIEQPLLHSLPNNRMFAFVFYFITFHSQKNLLKEKVHELHSSSSSSSPSLGQTQQ
ncbi:hypothetical protein BLA29_004653 [Euroglyphus maynei]|uniref:Uncharacterized protein n=1 Tax=Euroglyphus maynei TaxID=6958 RepID=A0A1Y3B6Z6_EURMA|nr:hypothetical protein BLA29_004653 [Euroglyphus maynei]